MSLTELKAHVDAAENDLIVLDVREREAFDSGHVPGAQLLPRGQLELRVNKRSTRPDAANPRVLRIRPPSPCSRQLRCARSAFSARSPLDGGMKAWREAGYPIET